MEKEIINEYLNTNISIEKLALKYKTGKLKIKAILENNNIEMKKRGGQQKYTSIPFKFELNNKILSCKICGEKFNDIENKSGALTKHIEKCNPTIEIPNKLFRTNYKKTTGEYWHFKFFNIIDKFETKTIKCPECDWNTIDLTNKSGVFTKHVLSNHGDINNFIKKHNDLKYLFNVYNNINERNNELINNSVVCKICGKNFKYINNKHLKTHNITLDEYKLKYLNTSFISESTIDKLKISYEKNLKYYESNFRSNPENEISKIIENCGVLVSLNNKDVLNGVEIDIYIPELKLGIEYNGNFYHTEEFGKDKYYHLNKQNIAKEHGVNLIHIFEDEWLLKKEICVSKIKHMLGKNNSEKIYARKTNIKIVNNDDCYQFLENNHIQGYSNKCKYNIGAYYNNILIGLMCFYKEKNYWVLNRFATNINYICVGVGSKLLSYFINNLSENLDIITFGDRNWIYDENDNIYTKLGFTLDKILKPDYKYYNPKISRNKRLHKFNFRKQILLKKYPEILNEEMTENEMTKIIGCKKIWDCGLFRYKKKGTN